MLEDIPNTAIDVDASGHGQCHKRPLHRDGFGSNGQSKENGGQQGCEYHDCSANVAR